MQKQITLILITLIMFQLSFTIIHEGNNAILIRFNRILTDKKNNNPILLEPGLHFKIPFIDFIQVLDNRIRTLNIQSNHFLSKENKEIFIDYYIKWRISNFKNYYISTEGNYSKIETMLDQISNEILHIKIAKLHIKDIINDLNVNLSKDIYKSLNNLNKNKIQTSIFYNQNKNNKLMSNTNIMEILGIKIIDIQINNINFANNELTCLLNKIRYERSSLAQNEIWKGKEEAKKIQKQAKYQASLIIDEAKKQASIIYGDTEFQVAKIFNDTFKNDIEFYVFIKSLNAYKNIFDKNKDLIIFNLDSEFFKYMKKPFVNMN
ncbi:protease modulator HflC [Pantoea sp. SoEX]|uniref:protease modulator HflC n=1 Tax=Pantoea sp. SoEX TaxID=2576763 RepID=UPI00135C37E7|nr:protease modulator HflC [Pantoea sp. SoEX]MXP51329.1 protease modulator HflC [Pantoea sp. SoEX]